MTTFPYATAPQAATAAAELIARVRAGTVATDVPTTVNQVHGIVGFALGLAVGRPGESGPIIPIGSPRAKREALTLDEADDRLHAVIEAGAIPSTGPASWFTVALRVALKAALAEVPEPLRSALLALIEKVL